MGGESTPAKVRLLNGRRVSASGTMSVGVAQLLLKSSANPANAKSVPVPARCSPLLLSGF
jgi:hypothetical protein